VGYRDTNQGLFLQQVLQRYGLSARRAKLAEQGFALVSEEVQEGERIHLVLAAHGMSRYAGVDIQE